MLFLWQCYVDIRIVKYFLVDETCVILIILENLVTRTAVVVKFCQYLYVDVYAKVLNIEAGNFFKIKYVLRLMCTWSKNAF